MLKGDLGATPLPDVLTSLAADGVTGCLHIADDSGDEALVYFRDGQVYAAYVPGRRPQLGARLISSGALAPEALAEALDAQENELQGWRLGELLVHLGYVDRPVVEAFTLEQLRESCFDLARWPSGRFRFRKNEKTRADVASHASVADLLAEVGRRRAQWEEMAGVVHGPAAVPVLSAGGLAAAEMTLDQDQWALLCKVDGERTITQLARDCGFTTFEAGQIVYSLVGAGLLDVEETFTAEEENEPEPDLRSAVSAIASVLGGGDAAGDETGTMSRLAEAFGPTDEDVAASELARLLGTAPEPAPEPEAVAEVAAEPEPAPEPVAEPEPLVAEEPVVQEPVVQQPVAEEPAAAEPAGPLHEDLSSELASLTAALADLPSLSLPPTLEPDFPAMPVEPLAEPVAEPVAEAPPAPVEPAAPPAAPVPVGSDDPFGDSLARVSEALSALLGDSLPAVAMPEAPKPPEPTPEEIEAARVEAERLERSRAAAAAELAEAHALAEASRAQKSGLRFGRRRDKAAEEAEDARGAAARLEAERVAAEAARQDAERQEAARAAAEEAARLEAERLAAEAARQDAERQEAARAEAERLAAEEAARQEAERQDAERQEAERQEAARQEAERRAAEEAALAEAERQEAARLEAERLAEEAARAEVERLAAEEAARAEAERQEAARLEAERLAAEEAARLEADRLEAERLAAEEAARQEAARLEAERLEADRLEAERLAAEEAARAEAERAAAAEPVDTLEVASLFRDLNDVALPVVEEPAPEADAAPDDPHVPDAAPATNGSRAGLSDTAALLRELTSLGLDDEPEPASPARTAAQSAQRPAPPKEQPKKRKGLFGRG